MNETIETKRRSLLDITSEMAVLSELLEDREGNVQDPEIEARLTEYLNKLGDDLDAKVDNYCALVRTKELLASARRAEAENLLKSAKTDENAAKGLKERLKHALTVLGIKKAGKLRQASIVNNGGRLPVVIPDDSPEAIPAEYQRVEITVDFDKVYNDLTAGKNLGTFAKLAERGTHLRIK